MATVDQSPADSGYGSPYLDSLILGTRWSGTVTYTFGETAGQTWTFAEQEAFRTAFAMFEAITNITFEYKQSYDVNLAEFEATSATWNDDPGTITLADHHYPGTDQGANGSDSVGRYNVNDPSWANLAVGGMGFSTIVHELGHALGLEHPHDGAELFPGVGRDNAFNDLGDFNMNQSIWTVMSYNRGWTQEPTSSNDFGHAGGLMALDIAALQRLYGTDWSTRSGNDTYALPDADGAGTFWTCIWDGAGIDTISNAGTAAAATIDLRAAPLVGANAGGYVSWVGGVSGGYTIANRAVIEIAIGGDGNDTIIGNSANNTLEGGLGADSIDGGSGSDTVSYRHSNAGVDIDLSRQNPASADFRAPSGGHAQGDRLISIENVIGSDFADRLVALNSGSQIHAGKGTDTIFLGNGNDSVTAGLGADTITDSAGDDTIYGGERNHVVNGGFEVVSAPVIGANGYAQPVSKIDGWTLLSGPGFELYTNGDAGTPAEGSFGIDMETTAANTNVGITQALADVETGQRYRLAFEASALAGASAKLEIYWGGQKLLWGEGGQGFIDPTTNPGLYYIDVFGGAGTGANKNRLTFVEIGGGDANGTLLDNIRFYKVEEGTAKADDADPALDGDDVFNLGSGGDLVFGNAGNDTANFSDLDGKTDHFDGGSGTDTLVMNWAGATEAITYGVLATSDSTSFGMAESFMIGSFGQRMYYKEVEHFILTGGQGNDVLKGGALSDTLTGNTGDDTLIGSGGIDVLDGGDGIDRALVELGGGNNTIDLKQAQGGGSLTLSNGTKLISIESVSLQVGDGNDFLDVRGTIVNPADLASTDPTFKRGQTNFDGRGGNDTLAIDLATSWTGRFIGGTGNDLLIMDWSAAASTIFRDADGSYKSYSHTVTVVGHGTTEYFYIMSFTGVERFDLKGGTNNDFLYGGTFNDTLNGHLGRDVLEFGAGTDTLVLDWTGYAYGVADSGITGESTLGGYDGNFNTTYGNTYRVDFTSAEHFNLTLTDLGDAITTGDGNDTVRGNGGDDTIRTGKGVDIVDGGTGSDRWQADKSFLTSTQSMVLDLSQTGVQATYLDTATIRGIEMLTLDTGAGNDIITTLAADFSDYLGTGAGTDRVKLMGGRDVASLGSGTDTLIIDWTGYAYGVADSGVTGGSLLLGYDGNFNTTYGNTNRADFSGVEHFILTLTELNDAITTGDGNDVVTSNGGDDTLRTGKGIDIVRGGTGNDRWEADKSFMTASQAMVLDLTRPTGQATYLGTGIVSAIEMLTLQTGEGDDTIITIGAEFNDFLATNGGADRVKLAGGRDSANLGAGTDTLIIDWTGYAYGVVDSGVTGGSLLLGYDGNFNTNYGNTNRADFLGVEHFNLTLTNKNDAVTLGDGNDTVNGGGGDDTLRTAKGIDIVDGGDGADRWEADKSALTRSQAMVLDLTLSGLQASYGGGSRTSNVEMLTLITGAGDDTIITRAEGFFDSISTNAGDDRVKVAGGRDVVNMGAGTDTLVVDWTGYGYGVNNGVAFVGGTAPEGGFNGAFDTTYGNTNRVDFTQVEQFDLTLTAQADSIRTGDGNDTVVAGAGADVLVTGKGIDTVDGGAEADGARGADGWTADKSAATTGMTIDLTKVSSTYVLGGVTATVRNIEYLGFADNADWPATLRFLTGSGNDIIITRAEFFNDRIGTGGGHDAVKVAGGRDDIAMGAGGDTLVVDWTGYAYGVADSGIVDGSFALGYNGNFNTRYGDTNYVAFTGVEHFSLTLTENDDVITVGNGDDTVVGNGGNDTLRTAKGVDIVNGGAGADLWVADKSQMTSAQAMVLDLTKTGTQATYLNKGLVTGIEALSLITGAGKDVITTLAAFFNDTITTNAGTDRVLVAGGRDSVNLGGGRDTLVLDWSGYAYSVSGSITGTLTKGYGGDFNTLYGNTNRVDFTGVEQFVLTLTNNDDAVTTGDDDDVINGAGGNDLMTGAGGNDSYFVDSAADRVIEAAGGGSDKVFTGVSYTLESLQEIERLQTTDAKGLAAINLTGNEFANTLIGNDGANRLDGKLGNDTLTGAGGDDVFVFSSDLGANNIDVISGFNAATDTIELENTLIFAALTTLGTLTAKAFNFGAAATELDDRIIYNRATGALLYDADGSRAGLAIQFATLTDLTGTLSNKDFLIV